MPAIATAPPAAPAKIASNLVLSHMPPETMQLLEQHGECPRWNPNTGHVGAFLAERPLIEVSAGRSGGLRCTRSPTGVRDSHASTLNIDLLAPSRSQTATVASRSSTNPVSIDCCNVQVGRVSVFRSSMSGRGCLSGGIEPRVSPQVRWAWRRRRRCTAQLLPGPDIPQYWSGHSVAVPENALAPNLR